MDLRAFGQRLDRVAAEGGPARLEDNDPLVSEDLDALSRIIQGAGQTLPGAARDRLTDPAFSKLVAEGNDPRVVAAGGPELAKIIYQSELEGLVDKPRSEWTAADAAKFTDGLADQLEAHPDDPDFQRALMTSAGQELERTAELVGRATEEKGDREDVEAMAAGLSRIGNAVPEDTRARLAVGVASKIDDDSELNYVDDGFDHFVDDGGSSDFRDTLGAALQELNKGEAADELGTRHQGGGGIGGVIKGAVGAVTSLPGAALDTVKDLGGTALSAGKSAWDFSVDVQRDVVNAGIDGAQAVGHFGVDRLNDAQQLAGDLARAPLRAGLAGLDTALRGAQALAPDQLDGLLQKGRDLTDLAQRGVDFTDQVQEKLGEIQTTLQHAGIDLAGGAAEGFNNLQAELKKDPVGTAKAIKDTVESAVNAIQIEHRIEELGPGDSYKLEAGLDASVLGVNGHLQGSMTVTRGTDGGYTLTVDGEVGAGVASRLGAQAGGPARAARPRPR